MGLILEHTHYLLLQLVPYHLLSKIIVQKMVKLFYFTLFIGLELMGSSMAPLENLPQFRTYG